ncbi:ornithine carbamoyltransferase [Blochmannia endosymbiont of Polyrhachis (Hedomyrma) turneri]|uniref:ornithine carbamoyltransferase n=1 Tax=Blochmannia endosymbiont of Polyrhachis (Hedomyrma) turneri TaxID=1505596 RepID=UPI00061A5A9D|nr:ornithine carbamoyltransferase [Blochmannia endosymbiont of Polyrhachis (Hedomyrma) turneri]AKC59629.1 Ornithine carbamoyltransferase [Blochmannia endosymbiont of Polyrhachis (Hedomyrma) turneri]
MNTLYQRSFLRLMDFTLDEIHSLLELAYKLKKNKHEKKETPQLIGKNIVLIFENNSTRTRCCFEVAAFDQGARTTCLHPNISQMGHKESIKDTAKILGRLYDGIQYRGYSQNIIQTFAQYSNIPVWNGLTAKFHPTQLLADLMTIQEQLAHKPFNQITLAYVGDTRNNIGNSLLEASAVIGMNLRLISPRIFWPKKNFFSQCQQLAKNKNADIILTENINEGVKNVDFLYTDVWVSMGEHEKIWEERITLLKKYQVNISMIEQTNNKNVKFLHCLPALHDEKTIIGKKIAKKYNLENGIEVTNEIFESDYSVVFEQAENRLHTIKSVMLATLLPDGIINANINNT